MAQVYNADLANSWGNLCSRAFNMVNKYVDGAVPELWEKTVARLTQEMGNPLAELAAGLYERYAQAMNNIDYSGALATVMELCDRANLYVEESAPWNLAKLSAAEQAEQEGAEVNGGSDDVDDVDGDGSGGVGDGADGSGSADAGDPKAATAPTHADRLGFVLYNILESIRIMALLFAPVMPTTSAEVWCRLGLGDVRAVDELATVSCWGGLPAGNTVVVGEPLFPRLKEDEL
jgi:methionyl-tRNA synthetase